MIQADRYLHCNIAFQEVPKTKVPKKEFPLQDWNEIQLQGLINNIESIVDCNINSRNISKLKNLDGYKFLTNMPASQLNDLKPDVVENLFLKLFPQVTINEYKFLKNHMGLAGLENIIRLELEKKRAKLENLNNSIEFSRN